MAEKSDQKTGASFLKKIWTGSKAFVTGAAVATAFVLGRFTDVVTVFDWIQRPQLECWYSRSLTFEDEQTAFQTADSSSVRLVSAPADAIVLTNVVQIAWVNEGRRAAEDVTVVARTQRDRMSFLSGKSTVGPPPPLTPVEIASSQNSFSFHQEQVYWKDVTVVTALVDYTVIPQDTPRVAVDLLYRDRRIKCQQLQGDVRERAQLGTR